MTFIGGVVAYRRAQHAPVRAVLNLLPEHVARFCHTLADLLVLTGALLAAVTSYWLIEAGWQERTPILGIPVVRDRSAARAGNDLIGDLCVRTLFEDALVKLALASRIPLAAVLGLAVATQSVWQPFFTGDAAVFTVLALFAIGVSRGSRSVLH